MKMSGFLLGLTACWVLVSSVTAVGCLNYGHSCLGAHGKRGGGPWATSSGIPSTRVLNNKIQQVPIPLLLYRLQQDAAVSRQNPSQPRSVSRWVASRPGHIVSLTPDMAENQRSRLRRSGHSYSDKVNWTANDFLRSLVLAPTRPQMNGLDEARAVKQRLYEGDEIMGEYLVGDEGDSTEGVPKEEPRAVRDLSAEAASMDSNTNQVLMDLDRERQYGPSSTV